MNLNRRAFLTSLGASTAATTVARGATPPTPLVYDVRATVYKPLLTSRFPKTIQLDFTAKHAGVLVGNATAFGPNVFEATHALANILRPGSPEAADWVTNVWHPQALDPPEDPWEAPRERYDLGKTALYYDGLDDG